MGIRLVLNASLTYERHVKEWRVPGSGGANTGVGKISVAQDPCAWLRPCAVEGAGLHACASWGRQSLGRGHSSYTISLL